jgi:hypothetical protein
MVFRDYPLKTTEDRLLFALSVAPQFYNEDLCGNIKPYKALVFLCERKVALPN